ncbi:MAG TPA: autotransporter assembly complex family protein [Steroidobacteraceae bacterium]|nr:autotransporter assembly complex family protein [Steroidobacteraceae bacterium]
MSWLVPVLLSLAPWTAGAAQLTVTVEGLKNDELREAARANLTLQNYASRDVSPSQIRRLFNGAEKEIKAALEPYGYYNSTVTSNLQTTDKGLNAVFQVTPGEQVKVKDRKVVVEGDAAKMPAVRRALRRFNPDVGEPLDHGVYEQSKGAVEAALLGAGYLRMKATQHRVEVSRKENTATIDLEYQTGPRLRFGTVKFTGGQFSPEFMERYIPWKPHDYYSPDEVLSFQQRMVDADYFSTVAVQPDLEHADDTEVPIEVQLAPAKRSVYTAGVYFSTDTGAGVRLGTQRRWVNDSGHKFQADIDYAQRLKALSTSYGIPLPGPNDKSLNFGITHRDEDTTTSQSRTDRLAVNESRKWKGFTRTVGLQYLAGTFEIGDEQSYSKLLYAEATLSRKDADDFFFPRRGYSLAFGARFSPETVLSDTKFTQLTADAKWIQRLGRRQRLILRSSLGAMHVQDFDELPPELRFFAGGDRSIRGFDYQQLGTTNAAGEVIGGTYLAVASAEIERYFLPKWGAAIFVDGGDAFRSGEFDLNVGAGIGLRWRSPVGILRLDVGKPVKSALAHSIQFHISVGPDL